MPTVGEFFSYAIAALALILNFVRGQRENKADSESRGRWQGGVDKTLEQLLKTTQATEDKVGDLAAVPAKMDGLERRIGSLEGKFDEHCKAERGEF